MLLALAVVAGILLLLFSSNGAGRQGATVGEIASARAIASARLRQLEEERQDRFRLYHAKWAAARGRTPAHGYVVPFTAGARRG